ncbi:LacI family DNA-binding transcriptional regulator [Streptomyces sp. ME02-6979-3A]|uniref:LacI family DNA-binding transcriptional regulator n=1 Tax=Streptomyces silvae TaxID=2803812 RepID=A0ABU8ABT3_9ACTN|nr:MULTISPECIES: LacI family DNA-binding transcriptional regulator [unclassified Streptomyces]MDX3323226.1 LacI family DNA-binding transcriptional regulator [Streptomyces sp. ME02-6979-3A]
MTVRITMADVARAVGVSTATVSHVLSGKRAVADETRQVVEAAIADLGFTVNTVARSLRTGRSGIVALVVPDLSNPPSSRPPSRKSCARSVCTSWSAIRTRTGTRSGRTCGRRSSSASRVS